MILSIGIDSVEIYRCGSWATMSHLRLRRLFSEQEIAYCLSVPAKAAERFALRFAAKEAFYKAIISLIPHKISLFAVCKKVSLHSTQQGPHLEVDWNYFRSYAGATSLEHIKIHISGTHTRTTATAVVILEKRP